MDETRIKLLVNRIFERKEGADSKAATFRDVADMKEIAAISDTEGEPTELAYRLNSFLAEQYESMGRFSVAAIFREKALKIAKALTAQGKPAPDDLSDMLALLLRDRNFYIDDDCEEIRALVCGLLVQEEIDRRFAAMKNRRRNLRHDPVEMSEAYLAVIDAVEEKIEKNRKFRGLGACFEIWELKRNYLAEYGIFWKSPAALNPFVRFD